MGLLPLLASCNNTADTALGTGDSSLLSTNMVQNAATLEGTDSSSLSKMPQMMFSDTAHNFGNLKDGEVVEYDFKFTNTGGVPLLVTGAESTCGCTASDFNRAPIAPGASDRIRVRFDSKGKSGHQEKTVTIFANTPNTPTLQITAEVASN
jgi:hypothetical protein